MTALAIGPCCFAVAADAAGAGAASAWLAEVCGAHAVPAEQVYRLDTCLTEVLANIIAHGGEGARSAPVALALTFGDAGSDVAATLSIADHGRPFDPFAGTPAPRAATLAEATPGGLGLTLIRDFSDGRSYAFREARNCLTLRFRWPSAG